MPKVTIQSGNTLTGIAKGTGYTPEQLAAYNMIEDPNKIRVGQDIFIPYSRQEFESFAGPMEQPAQATAPVQPLAPPQSVVQTSQAEVVDPDAPTFSERFINYVGKVEGIINEKGGEQGRTPFRYPSKEGGLDTVGIGHKLTQDQIDSNSVYGYDLDTLTQEQVDLIFLKDLELTVKGLDTVLQKEHSISYKDLTPKQQEMLLDIHFNVKTGIKAFPKFTESVIKNDLPKMKKEYLRYMKDKDTGKMVPLGRNKIFYDTYLK